MNFEPMPVDPNSSVIEAWNTILFDKFHRFRDLVIRGFAPHGTAAMVSAHLRRGERVLDVGCGFGDTTVQLAAAVGPTGEAVGLDCAERFVEEGRRLAAIVGVANARFVVADAQTSVLDGDFDVVYSRFGTMFFDNPVAAMRNLRRSLRPGGRLAMVVWRNKVDNEAFRLPEAVLEPILSVPENENALTCGPGPFSMANPEVVQAILAKAGFIDVSLVRNDELIETGETLADAVDFALTLGPAGELVRLAGEEAERRRPQIEAIVREALRPHLTNRGVMLGTSTWIVTAATTRG